MVSETKLLEIYMTGFIDEMEGAEKIKYQDRLCKKAYNLGRKNAKNVDDASIMEHDDRKILKEILSD
jgi:hypothetical protein